MSPTLRLAAAIAAIAAAAGLIAASTPGWAAPGDATASLDAPCRYPAGLACQGDRFYVADWREATIHEIRVKDGTPARSFPAPTLKPQGLCMAGDRLVVCDDHTGGIFFVDPATGAVEHSFAAPESAAEGLAYHDGVLFVLARGTIYRVMPEDGTILGSFPSPDPSCRCLAHDGRHLWVSNRMRDEIYMVDPDRGKVVNILPSPGPYPAGLAWQDGQLWNVDFQTRRIYRIVVHDEQPYRLGDVRRARVEYLWALNNYGPGDVTGLTVQVAVPPPLPHQRLLSKIEYTPAPAGTARDRFGQECALFRFDRVPAGGKAVVTYSVLAQVSAIRYMIFPDEVGPLEDIPREILRTYTADGSRYRIESPFIRKTAREVVGDETNPYWMARRIYDHLLDRLHYEMVGGWDVPEVVLRRGSGSCSEYTFSFIALCRAVGLPARYQGSVVVRGDDASIDQAFHRWAQVYLPGYGWVPVDANRGDKPSPADQGRGFGGLADRFLITTQGGGDSKLLSWGYNSFARHGATGFCKVEEDNLGFWEPAD